MARRNPPIGQDSAVDYGTGVVSLGQEDKYVLPEMEASVRRAADETLSGKRLPKIDPVTGEHLGFTGSKTLKPGWMQDPKKAGAYFEPEETLAVLKQLGAGRWPTTKKRERIAGQIEQALYMDAETEKALAAGGGEDEPPKTDAGGPEFLSSLEFSRPRVRVDIEGRTFTLGKRSPYKGKVDMVNPVTRTASGNLVLAFSKRAERDKAHERMKDAGIYTTIAYNMSEPGRPRFRIQVPGRHAQTVMRLFPRTVWKENPLTRRETAEVLRRARKFFAEPEEVLRFRGDEAAYLARKYGAAKVHRRPTTPEDRQVFQDFFGSNPLTRRESSVVLRGVRQDLRLAKRASPGTPSKAYHLGRVDIGQALAYQYGEAKLRRMRGHDLGSEFKMNPRVLGTIPGRMTRIEYQRTGEHPGRYYHNFKSGVSARLLSDGSVLLQGPRRLHVKE